MSAQDQTILRIGSTALKFITVNDDATVFESLTPSDGRAPAAHYHDAVDETVYLLEGAMTVTVDGRTRDLGPGDSIFIPRGSAHQSVSGEGRLRYLAMLTPGVIGLGYFEEMAELASTQADPARMLVF